MVDIWFINGEMDMFLTYGSYMANRGVCVRTYVYVYICIMCVNWQ